MRAERCAAPAFEPARTQHPRLQRGLRYESAVRLALETWADSRSGVTLEPGAWFRYRNTPTGAWRFAQPDILVDAGAALPLIVLEVKLTLGADAIAQLARYRDVVEAATGRAVRLAAVTQSFDPVVRTRVAPTTLALAIGPPDAWLDGLTVDPFDDTTIPVLQWRKPGAERLSVEKIRRNL